MKRYLIVPQRTSRTAGCKGFVSCATARSDGNSNDAKLIHPSNGQVQHNALITGPYLRRRFPFSQLQQN